MRLFLLDLCNTQKSIPCADVTCFLITHHSILLHLSTVLIGQITRFKGKWDWHWRGWYEHVHKPMMPDVNGPMLKRTTFLDQILGQFFCHLVWMVAPRSCVLATCDFGARPCSPQLFSWFSRPAVVHPLNVSTLQLLFHLWHCFAESSVADVLAAKENGNTSSNILCCQTLSLATQNMFARCVAV